MINGGKDPMQYRRLFHNFTTHSFALMGRNGQPRVSKHALSCYRERSRRTAAAFVLKVEVRAGPFSSSTVRLLYPRSCFSFDLPTPDAPLSGSALGLFKIFFKANVHCWHTWEAEANIVSIQTTHGEAKHSEFFSCLLPKRSCVRGGRGIVSATVPPWSAENCLFFFPFFVVCQSSLGEKWIPRGGGKQIKQYVNSGKYRAGMVGPSP